MSAAEEIAGNELPQMGHNLPSDPVEALRLQLADKNSDLTARRDELLEGVKRAPATILDQETAEKVAAFTKQLKGARKLGEDRRKADKEPHLEACRTVDTFYKGLIDPLQQSAATLEGRLTVYQKMVAERERQRREEEERKAAEEAAAREAAMRNEEDLEAAIAAEEHAKAASQAVQAPVTELGRVTGDYGVNSSLRTFWAFEITGPVDLDALRPYIDAAAIEKAIRAAIKDGVRDPAIRGVRIFRDSKAQV